MGNIGILAADLELVLRSIYLVQDQEYSRYPLLEISSRCFCCCWSSWYTIVAPCALSASVQTSQHALGAADVVGAWDHDHAIRHHIYPNI